MGKKVEMNTNNLVVMCKTLCTVLKYMLSSSDIWLSSHQSGLVCAPGFHTGF